jgi:hypothetical protein
MVLRRFWLLEIAASVERATLLVLSVMTIWRNYGSSVIIVIVINITTSFMQSIHTSVPETNHVSRVYSVAAILRVLLMVHIALSAILKSFVLLH